MAKYYIEPLDITLLTNHDWPSIPIRYLDWSCVDTNYDGAPDAGPQLMGQGRTEQLAIDDYFNQLEEI